MLLIGVKESHNWLSSRWILTYKVGWDKIVKACAFSADYYSQFDVLKDNQVITVKNSDDYLAVPESLSLTFRGMSHILGVPVTITFYNQTNTVDVSVAMANEEFSKADYESFNKSMAQYLNSIELAMYR